MHPLQLIPEQLTKPLTLCNPGESLAPLLIYSTANHKKTSLSIKEDISNAIKTVGNLRIIAIVGDNYRAQVKACSKIIQNNMTTLYFIPCSYHLINLVIHDVFNESNEFRSMIDQVRNLSVLFNKFAKQQILNFYAPEHVPTRWVNDLDIAFFIYNKLDLFHQIFKENLEILGFIDNDLQDLVLLLIPLRSALQMLEGNFSKIGDILPILKQVKLFYDDHKFLLKKESSEHICEIIANIIDRRFSHTNVGHTIQLSYVVTPHGRHFLRTSLKEGTYAKDLMEEDLDISLSYGDCFKTMDFPTLEKFRVHYIQ